MQGFDGGKFVTGRKRHILVDTCGFLLAMLVTSATVQDRDSARVLLQKGERSRPLGSAGGGGWWVWLVITLLTSLGLALLWRRRR